MSTPAVALTLETRVQRLEDLDALRDLTARYVFHVNQGWNGQVVDVEAMPSLFTDDVTYRSPDMPALSSVGLTEGMEVLRRTTAHLDVAMHGLANPILTVDGDAAAGDWLMWIVSRAGGVATQVFASIEVAYVRLPHGWRIRAIDFHIGLALRGDALRPG